MNGSSLDAAARSLDMAGWPTRNRADENALRRDIIRVEAPKRALEAANRRSDTGTINPSPGTQGGAIGR